MHSDETITEWLARYILPHEGSVRARLRRTDMTTDDIDDVIQEAYARLAALPDFKQISNPGAYFLQVARNIMFDQFRRSRIVRIESFAELEFLNVKQDVPDAECQLSTRQELKRLWNLVQNLPNRCRDIFIMRKIEGLSQKDISKRLGVTENTVESQVQRGLRLILKQWATSHVEQDTNRQTRGPHSVRKRQQNEPESG
jgi:RNA polymerase sigma-70 factor (ECF subfamily)